MPANPGAMLRATTYTLLPLGCPVGGGVVVPPSPVALEGGLSVVAFALFLPCDGEVLLRDLAAAGFAGEGEVLLAPAALDRLLVILWLSPSTPGADAGSFSSPLAAAGWRSAIGGAFKVSSGPFTVFSHPPSTNAWGLKSAIPTAGKAGDPLPGGRVCSPCTLSVTGTPTLRGAPTCSAGARAPAVSATGGVLPPAPRGSCCIASRGFAHTFCWPVGACATTPVGTPTLRGAPTCSAGARAPAVSATGGVLPPAPRGSCCIASRGFAHTFCWPVGACATTPVGTPTLRGAPTLSAGALAPSIASPLPHSPLFAFSPSSAIFF